MSGVGSRTISGTPSSFLSLPSAAALGRKSATAAAMTTTSAAAARASTAASISAAVSTWTTSSPAGTGGRGGRDQRDAAPRAAASSAMAWPCLPDERLPMKRTGSMGSRVPPAVTSTCSPARSWRRPSERGRRAATMASGVGQAAGAARRPRPGGPTSGSTTCTPRRRSVATLSWTAGCSHISVCMAGQTTTGALVARKTDQVPWPPFAVAVTPGTPASTAASMALRVASWPAPAGVAADAGAARATDNATAVAATRVVRVVRTVMSCSP